METMPSTDAGLDGTGQSDRRGPAITFEPPGPGEWMLDTTHHGRRPVTGFLGPLMVENFEKGMTDLFATYGLPLATMQGRLVNGCFYARPKAVGEGDKPSAAPPTFILKIIARLHPELRRRNKAAANAWATKRWRQDVDNWFDRDREPTIALMSRLQAVDLGTLDTDGLIGHLEELVDTLRRMIYLGMATHGGDIIPNGDFFAHCAEWGIDTGDAADLLKGSSPASSEASRLLEPIARALASAASPPATVQEIRALGPDVAAAVDRWIHLFAWRVIDSDDLDATTLAEQPNLLFAALTSPGRSVADGSVPDPSALRSQVPPVHRDLFDELLVEARYGLRLRDDNVGVRWCWPVGLTRRALLEVGDRLQSDGQLSDATHAIELSPSEAVDLLRGAPHPTADAVAERAAFRVAVEAAGPPTSLGEPEGEPPIDAFPTPMARATRAILALLEAMEGTPLDQPATGSTLTGTGVGRTSYVGVARVVDGIDDTIDRLQDGDVLVTRFTGPAYNSILGIAGAMVVEEGGPLCHAAIVSRELGLPAVIGVTGATSRIADGVRVEVDPVAGSVRML